MNTKEITLCGQQVNVTYDTASEQGFESLSGKSINDIDFTRTTDMFNLSVACIVSAYDADNQKAPITSKDILHNATSKELEDLYLTVINLRAEWYSVPKFIADQLDKEAEGMTEAEREEAAKNAPAPTSDTADS